MKTQNNPLSPTRFVPVALGVVFTLAAQPADAAVSATHIADSQSAILNETITVSIDPSNTNWVAWHSGTMPSNVGGADFVGSYSWIAVDDYFDLTITNPSGGSQTLTMDYNDAFGLSTGPQAVIFGSASDAPNVARWGASWSPASAGRAGSPKIFDEAGAFNSIFTSAGEYTFAFRSGNTGSTVVGYPDMYLLVDTIPEPSALLLAGVGGILLVRRRRPGNQIFP